LIQSALAEGVKIKDISREPRMSPRDAPRKITHTIALVPCNYVGTLWDNVKNYLGPAVARSRGRWSIELLHEALLNERQNLWVAFDKEKSIDGVATTEFLIYPCKKMLSIEYLGGKNMTNWGWDMLDRLDSWGRDNKCDGIEAVARQGFWRWLKQDGFDRSYTVYEREIT
jgi:hypothetical protein|tara:strand:- start:2547 stop:3056 length:510 start_codon:yes stop_codon:yes gene_type:complete